tara:strand:+ start:420 stop:587 length:168 start_codon:yes stop_codon:yes gene_type:complete
MEYIKITIGFSIIWKCLNQLGPQAIFVLVLTSEIIGNINLAACVGALCFLHVITR